MSGICRKRIFNRLAGLSVILLAAYGCNRPLAAQSTSRADQSSAPPALQVQVLVLEPNHERLDQPIRAGQFSVRIDSGPWFHPTSVRQEGDDPISLAILLDVQGKESNLMSAIDKEIADLAPNFLHPQDHVSIYALDCALTQSADRLEGGAARNRRQSRQE